MRVPDDAMPVYYDLLLDEPLDPAARAARRRSARWRARSRRATTARRRRAAAEARFDAPARASTSCPDDIEEFAFAADGRRGAPARADRARPSGSRAPRRAGCSPRAGCRLDGERARRRDAGPAGGHAGRRRPAGGPAAVQAVTLR